MLYRGFVITVVRGTATVTPHDDPGFVLQVVHARTDAEAVEVARGFVDGFCAGEAQAFWQELGEAG